MDSLSPYLITVFCLDEIIEYNGFVIEWRLKNSSDNSSDSCSATNNETCSPINMVRHNNQTIPGSGHGLKLLLKINREKYVTPIELVGPQDVYQMMNVLNSGSRGVYSNHEESILGTWDEYDEGLKV